MTHLRESNAERFDRIRHTAIEGHSVSNSDAKWLCAQLMVASDVNHQLNKRLKEFTAPQEELGGPVGGDPL